jgi:hypothetical protein
MKILLACLMCFVLSTSECFALKGGPIFPGSQTSITGTYAGVLMPTDASNSLAIFSLRLPSTGIGNGTLVIFNVGQVYSGTLQGTGDPDKGDVTGLIQATFPYITVVPSGVDDNGNPTFDTVTVVATAAGKMEGKIKSSDKSFSTRSTRLSGRADVEFSLTVNNPFDEIIYDIIGFKQSDT